MIKLKNLLGMIILHCGGNCVVMFFIYRITVGSMQTLIFLVPFAT